MFSTSRFHVSGAAVPSSKNDREMLARGTCVEELDVKAVANGRLGGFVG
jgi:hypothetical protein